ncbi:hypothetical protein DACRYDRAFT_61370 [Dacryopinax primogenitus]|uniref:PCI domain-containing protein n=1 Tax=Dacryopinax primogenitus (strain DJM 731) TaxID=1858805 RepID=M5G8P6_DACPD|nr:uncharacterized protein DACRYDRAFT_61370 [Dacryopinax primogenitus]EJU06586.1 hypothetical protein DACRYDRAFT_61370 [Dacryopinax primogenitus]
MAPPQLVANYERLKAAFGSPHADQKSIGQLLLQLKIALTEARLLIPGSNSSLEDLVITRDVLEMGAFWSVRNKDIPAFDRYFSQLQTFYLDFRSQLPPSPREYPLIGLNLIRLLTQNRIGDFHTTLETLPPNILGENPFIQHPVHLERWLMEGSYNKVWQEREAAPSEEYKFFVDSLMETIRREIASCEEKAYDSLPLSDAMNLLFFTKPSDLMIFAQERGWNVDPTTQAIHFARKAEETIEIPKEKIIINSLAYAKELEQIV